MTGSDRQHNMGDRESQSLAPGTEWGTKRGESFSDAVFAIVVTQLILDVQVPPPGQLRGDPIDLLKVFHSCGSAMFSERVRGAE